MAIYLNELVSGSGTTITLRRATGVSGSTVFGTGSGDTHNFTGSVYVSGTLEANAYRVNTIDTSEGSTIFGNDSGDSHRFTGSIYIGDDTKLYFGTGNDVSLEYDEDGQDTLSIAGGDVQIADDKKLFFGAAKDASIEYDEDGTDRLIISGSAAGIEVTGSTRFAGAVTLNSAVVTQGFTATNEAFEIASGMGGATLSMQGNSTLAGSTAIGNNLAQTHTFTGSILQTGSGGTNRFNDSNRFGSISTHTHQFTGSVYIGDDTKLYFGTGNDVSIEYDEDGQDTLSIAGGDVQIADDKSLFFGDSKEASIKYRETSDNLLVISGSGTGLVISGSKMVFDSVTVASGAIAGPGSYLGVNSSGQVVLTASLDPDGNPVTALNNATESRLVTVGNTTTELDGEANLTYDGTTFVIGDDARVNDDLPLYFGTNSDASIKYDESATDRLIISGSAVGIEITGSTRFAGAVTLNSAVVTQGLTAANEAFEIAGAGMGGATLSMQGSSTLAGSTVIGNNLAQTHTFTGSILQTGSGGTNHFNDSNRFGSISTHTHQFTGSVYIGDDTKLYFGTGNDVSIEYDEDGQDTLSIAGGDVQIADDKNLYFGDAKEASIKYRETSDNLLVIAGSSTGAVVSGSNLYLESHGSNLRLYSYTAGGMGPQNGPIFLTGSAIYTPDESSLVLGDATISNETGLLTIDSPGVTINDKAAAPKLTFEVHYTGSKRPTQLSNDTGGGEVAYFGTGSTTAGFLYYLNTDGGWQKTNANATGSYGSTGAGNASLLGVALGTGPGTHGMLIKGFFDVNTAFSGAFLKGQAVYVCSGAAAQQGIMSGAAPTGADSYVRIVGYGTDTANVIYFNPDSTWVENS
jgi:hypothetical protein